MQELPSARADEKTPGQPWRQIAASRGTTRQPRTPTANGCSAATPHGRHINPARLRQRLGKQFSAKAARLGTLHELTKLAPVAILAEALGYAPSTIERHAVDSATAYGGYIAAIRDT